MKLVLIDGPYSPLHILHSHEAFMKAQVVPNCILKHTARYANANSFYIYYLNAVTKHNKGGNTITAIIYFIVAITLRETEEEGQSDTSP